MVHSPFPMWLSLVTFPKQTTVAPVSLPLPLAPSISPSPRPPLAIAPDPSQLQTTLLAARFQSTSPVMRQTFPSPLLQMASLPPPSPLAPPPLTTCRSWRSTAFPVPSRSLVPARPASLCALFHQLRSPPAPQQRPLQS